MSCRGIRHDLIAVMQEQQAVLHLRLAPVLVALGAALCLARPTRADAQSTPPSVAQLRAQLTALEHARPAGITQGTVESIGYNIDVSERIADRFGPQSVEWRRRAEHFLARAREGHEPFLEAQNQIVNRGYTTPISRIRQGYAVYLPPHYDPSRAYPMMVVLHGGSSNGNLFLGVVLGNNMDWLTYSSHLWDEYTPRWSPEWIVVAPDGYGQVMWRWMGEQDVLDVVADTRRHYNVDADRVVLCGLSNGGVGAYSIGTRHASEFSAVLAIAGSPGWRQYTGGRPRDDENVLLRRLSAIDMAENATNTSFRAYHGHFDPGPMRPAYFEEFVALVQRENLPIRTTWYDMGHDLLYVVHRHGVLYRELENVRRDPRPHEVRVVTGDYRANRQHWVTVTRIEDYPHLARVRAVAEGDAITVQTSANTMAFSLDVRDVPLAQGDQARIVVDGHDLYAGARAALGHITSIVRRDGAWRLGVAEAPGGALEKRPGLSGPISDAYYDGMIHVYGTHNPDHVAAMRQAAERGARGWPIWLWNHSQRVVADSDVTDEMMRTSHLVLYGSPGDNTVLERIAAQLPIRADATGVSVGGQRFEGSRVGAKFVYPNPLAQGRYVIVQTGVTPEAVASGYNLPDFVPDFFVYDQNTTRARPRLVSGPFRPLASGFFDRHWQLPPEAQSAARRGVRTGRVGDRITVPREATLPAVVAAPSAAAALAAPRGAKPAGDGAKPDGELDKREQRGAQQRTEEAPPLGGGEATATEGGGRADDAPRREHWGGTLPIPPAPPTPPRPTHFLASARDPAGAVARRMASRIARFRNFRSEVAGATWRTDDQGQWSIRPQRECLAALRAAHIPAQLWAGPLPTPVATPVELTGPVEGVRFRNMDETQPVVVACELAVRLPVLAAVLLRHDVRTVDVLSAYRDHPFTSFHTFGLALDLARFHTRAGVLVVERDFQQTPGDETCSAPPATTEPARALREIACDLVGTHQLSSVLTPNYNQGHHNHFHVDIRPDDPRQFSR